MGFCLSYSLSPIGLPVVAVGCVCEVGGGSFRFHEIHFNHPLQSTTLCNYKALMLKYKKKTHQESNIIKLASGNMKIHKTHN